MDPTLAVALIAGVVSLASARTSYISSKYIEKLKFDNEQSQEAAKHRREISKYSEPLARSAYDLQSRLYKILCKDFVAIYLTGGNEREKHYAVHNTAFAIAQYFCWTELVRRDIQYINLEESSRTRHLSSLQDALYTIWGTDRYSPLLRFFPGEQRAIGEALIHEGVRGPECMGYGAFLKTFGPSTNPLIDAICADVSALPNGLDQAKDRLQEAQHALIDLLELLDADHTRFPWQGLSKV